MHRSSVALTGVFLALALACDDSSTTPGTGSPNDRTAPNAVQDLALAYDADANEVAFTWTAPRDDRATDRVAAYDLRYAYSFPLDWDRAVVVGDPPPPLVAGSPQGYRLVAPSRGRELYAAVRTVDAAGNESAVSSVVHLRVPGVELVATCVDAMLGTPVAGLDAHVTARLSTMMATDAAGMFMVDDITGGTVGVAITTGTALRRYHAIEDVFLLQEDRALTYPMVEFMPTNSPLYDSVLELLGDALVVAGASQVLKKWDAYPIPWSASELVNVHGLDYLALARDAAARWNARVGLDVFVEVSSVPVTGVRMQFLPRAQMGAQNGITSYTNDADGYPLLDTIRILDEFADPVRLHSIMMHELGHTIRLGHLPDGFIMYAAQPLPTDISDDEVAVVRLMVALPNGTDLADYDATAPAIPSP